MVKFQTSLLLALLCPFSVLAKPFLEVQIKSYDIELGKPAYIKITAEGLQSDLSSLPLHALSEHFVLDSKDLITETVEQRVSESKPGRNAPIRRQTLSLKLYPRQTGEFRIPAFSLDNLSSDEKVLNVEEATTRGEKISLHWSLSSSEAWQREQTLVSLKITTPEEYATIKLAKPAVNGFEVNPLPVYRKWIKEKENGQSIITTGWSLLPLKPGNLTIDLPAIEYHLNGVTRRTFYLPKINLTIRPLPNYLPPTIPVGKIEIETSVTPSGMLKTGELAYWNISINSTSLTPYWLPPLLRQVKSDDTIQFYPANSKRSTRPDSIGVNGRVEHTVPFKTRKNGTTVLPDLQTLYFDPTTGKLETVIHKNERLVSSGTAVRILAPLTVAAFALYLSFLLFRYWNKRIRYAKQRQSALALMRKASTAADLLTGLRQLGSVEGWPSNITLSEWLKHCQDKYKCDNNLEQLLEELSCHYYGSCGQFELHNKPDSRFQIIQSTIVEQMTSPRKNMATTPDQQPPYLKPAIWDPDPR